MKRVFLFALTAGVLWIAPPAPARADDALRKQASAGLARAVKFLRGISTRGGYAGIYSLDLKTRYGEAKYHPAKPNQIWVQPPGTPTVGQVYLAAWRATGDKTYLQAARDVGRALAWGQSSHGGWTYLCDMSALTPRATKPPRPSRTDTFDDNTTQAATMYLMDLDQVLDEPWLDEAVRGATGFFRQSQSPNGAWPQRYPQSKGYGRYYTFNDNTINDCIRVMMRAHELYGREEFKQCARRGGDFIILSQLKPPQAGWAQQYSHDLQPAWARAFEPPGVCSAVTSRNIRTLLDVYVWTRDRKYLAPIPAAIDWLNRSKLDGKDRWARLYELKTNRPIYGDRDGKVHYTLAEISLERRRGYSWQGEYGVTGAIRRYNQLKTADLASLAVAAKRVPSAKDRARRAKGLESAVRAVLKALDGQGRWVADGYITTGTFVKNARVLVEYLAATRAEK